MDFEGSRKSANEVQPQVISRLTLNVDIGYSKTDLLQGRVFARCASRGDLQAPDRLFNRVDLRNCCTGWMAGQESLEIHP